MDEPLIYASDRYFDRYPCAECKISNRETRIFHNRELFDAKWLCRNCARDYEDLKKGYEILIMNSNKPLNSDLWKE